MRVTLDINIKIDSSYISSANVHLEDNFKWTALHHAAYSGQLSVVRLLVDAGAKVNHESLTLATPLSRAIENSSLGIVKYLMEKRADVRHENIIRLHFVQLDYSYIRMFSYLHLEHSLLDLANDFASPQVFNTIQTAYEQRGKKKRISKSKTRRRLKAKPKQKKNADIVC